MVEVRILKSEMDMHGFSDLPTTSDKLNWKSEIITMAARIKNCKPPHILGVHGDWGSGKTSFMRQVQLKLGGRIPDDGSVDMSELCNQTQGKSDRVISIWFDAWRYQHENSPIVALLQEMRRQMGVVPSIRKKFEKVGTVALETVLDILPSLGKSIGIEGLPSSEKIYRSGERWEKANYAESLSADSIKEQLLKTIQSLLPDKNDSRVVIFIDDLDRCNPKAAIRLLEGLKIYMSIPQCVFVIGMNERVLVEAISEEVSLGTENKHLKASHYLEKICTDIYRIPIPGSPLNLLNKWIESADYVKSLENGVGETNCLPPNPRKLKALANQWLRFASVLVCPKSSPSQKPIWAIRLLIAAYIYQFNRDLWERWRLNPDFWGEIVSWCVGMQQVGAIPEWRVSLALPYEFDNETVELDVKNNYINPGDITTFWIAPLIKRNQDHLKSVDFVPLLNRGL